MIFTPLAKIGFAAALAMASFSSVAGSQPAQQSQPPRGPELRLPGMPPIQLPPGTKLFGPKGEATTPQAERGDGNKRSNRADDSSRAAPKKSAATKKTKPVGRKAVLDDLFNRLGKAKSRRQARGIVRNIERTWLQSGSDTADLLMRRALLAMKKKNNKLALRLLDKVVILEPQWSEVWNKRATVRYFVDDPDGAVADIARTLAKEPRHFGALVGLGFILRQAKQDKFALQVFRRAIELNPQLKNIEKIIEKLKVSVEGHGI